MKKIILIITFFIFYSCNSVKLPIADKTVKITNKNKELKSKLKKYCLIQSHTLYGCQVHLNYKESDRNKFDFSINILKEVTSLGINSNNYILLERKKIDGYEISIYSADYKEDVWNKYKQNYKIISIYKIENGLVFLLQNDSTFEDNVSEYFLLDRFKELKFKIIHKKIMKKLHR